MRRFTIICASLSFLASVSILQSAAPRVVHVSLGETAPATQAATQATTRVSLELRHDGKELWPLALGASALDYGRVLEGTLTANDVRVSVRIMRAGERRDKPYVFPQSTSVTDYRIQAAINRDKLSGTWRASIDGKELGGSVTGTVTTPALPAAGFAAPVPGEHPRLLIRKADIPALREKARTPWGQRMLQRLQATYPYKSNMAGARAMLYMLTEQRKWAEEARTLLEADLDEHGWLNVGPVHDPARRAMEDCIAYDLIHDTLDEAFRQRFRDLMARRVGTLYGFNHIIRPNGDDASNWSALFRSGCGVVALTMTGEKGVLYPDPAKPQLARIAAPQDLRVGEGVPVVRLPADKVWHDWLYAGPFKLRFGQDALADLGGAANARPDVTTKVKAEAPGRSAGGTFSPVPREAIVTKQSHQAPRWMVGDVCLAAPHVKAPLSRNVPFSTVYCYSVIENDRPGYYRVDLIDYQLNDPAVFIAGQRLVRGDYVYLEKGRFPIMAVLPVLRLVATNSHDRNYIAFHLALKSATDEEARQWLDAQTRWHAAELEDLKFRREYCARTGRADPMAEFWVEHARRRVEAWLQIANGEYAFNAEGEAYNQHAFRCVLPLAHLYQNTTGLPLSPSVNQGQLLLGYAARTIFREDSASLHTNTNGGGPLGVDSWARGFATVPDKFRPAVLWAWDRTQALADAGKLGGPWLTVDKLDPLSAAFMFVNYPVDGKPAAPGAVVPHVIADTHKGAYVFRNCWHDADDVAATFLAVKTVGGARNTNGAGTFQISGLGCDWVARSAEVPDAKGANRVHLPGVMPKGSVDGDVIHLLPQKDGSGEICVRLDEAYPGRKATRWFTADYSGRSGATALFAVADRIERGKGDAMWQLVTDQSVPVSINGNRVTLKAAGGATFCVTVVNPARAKIEAIPDEHKFEAQYLDVHRNATFKRTVIRVTGGDSFLVLMTLQRGEAPMVKVGASGEPTVLSVGHQKVRFDGRRLSAGE